MRDEDVRAAFLVAGDMVHEMPEIVDAITKQLREEARKKAMAAARRKYSNGGLAEQLGGYVPEGMTWDDLDPSKKPDGE